MKLHLDYASAPHAHPKWVWLLLAVAIASLAICAWAYVDRQAEHDGLLLRLEARTRAEKPARRLPIPVEQQAALDARAESAKVVLRELGRPWPTLFERLEARHGERIALLSVNIEGAKGTLRIAGEGRRLVDVLEYVERLSTDAFLTEVVLEQHEVVESDAREAGEVFVERSLGERMMLAVTDVQWYVRRALRKLGMPGLVALAVTGAALLLAFAGLKPQSEAVAGLRAELSRPAVRAYARDGAPDTGQQLAGDLENFSARFPTIVQLSGQLDALFDLAAAQGLSVNRGEYALVEKTAGQWRRFELTLPVTGTYPQVRGLVREMLANMPALAISDIALEREKIADGQLRATLRLVVFVSKGA